MNTCTRGATLDMSNTKSDLPQSPETQLREGDIVGGQLCQLSMESTGYR